MKAMTAFLCPLAYVLALLGWIYWAFLDGAHRTRV